MAEDEINLINYIKVIIKQKWTILIVVFTVLLLGFISSARVKKEYKDSVFLETGQMYIYKGGAPSTFTPEAFSEIQEKINNGLYNDSMAGVNASKITSVEVVAPEELDKSGKGSRIVNIVATSTNSEALSDYLEKLSDVIIDQHKEKFKEQKDYLENVVSLEKNKLRALDRDPNMAALQYLYTAHLSIIDDAEKSLSSIEQTKVLKAPSKKVTAQKNNLLMKLLIFLILGLLLGIALAFIKEFFQKNKDLLKE